MTEPRFFLTGPTKGLPDENRPSFDEAYSTLLSKAILTPVAEYFTSVKKRFDLVMSSDGVVVLPAWGRDEQARAEVLLAVALNKPIYAYYQHRPEKLEQLSNVKIVTRAEIING